MKQSAVHQLVLEVVRTVAIGRPVTAGTDFTRIGIGPWQRQRFFGPLRDALGHRGIDITRRGVTRESFTRYQTVDDVQAAIWPIVRDEQSNGRSPVTRPVPATSKLGGSHEH